MFTHSNPIVDAFVDLLVFVVDNGVSEYDIGVGRVRTHILKFISINLLQTLEQVQQSLKVDVHELIKNLTHMINFQFYKSEGWGEVHPIVKHQSCEIDFQDMWIKRRKLAEASANSSTSSENHRSSIYEYSTQITQMLMEMIVTNQQSLDSLYSHVNNAILVLHAVARNAPCIIRGELINVAGTDDKIVKVNYRVKDRNAIKGASACLYNLGGTTSYMNSTIQCLHVVPELKSALIKWHPLFEINKDHLLTAATRDLFEELDKNGLPVDPRKFLQLFREKYPKSCELDNDHNPQDAEECWMRLLDTLSQSLKSPGFSSENLDIVRDLFDIKLVSSVHCQGSGEKNLEEKSVRMLKWHVSETVHHLHEGLKHYLGSDSSGRPFRIGGLPRYLTIRFLRTDKKPNVQIDLLTVNVYDLCSDELRAKLEAARKGLSDGSGDLYKATTCKEGFTSEQETRLTGVYDFVAVVAYTKHRPHPDICSSGHYSTIIMHKEPDFRFHRGEFIKYIDERQYMLRNIHGIEQIMRGGCEGLAPNICLYKARAVPMDKVGDKVGSGTIC